MSAPARPSPTHAESPLPFQWHALSREEQAKYYDKARVERQTHMRLYPGWTARDNYAKHKKKARKRDLGGGNGGGGGGLGGLGQGGRDAGGSGGGSARTTRVLYERVYNLVGHVNGIGVAVRQRERA